MEKKSKITVVTVCYNAEKEIEHTMRSVLDQTYNNLEYLIIDGASKDKTLEVVNNVLSDYPGRMVNLISEPDKGIFDAMNKGIMHATGVWINFMNVGDSFYDIYVLEKLFSNSFDDKCGVVFGDTYNEKGLFKMTPFFYTPDKYCEMGICHQSIFVLTKLAKEHPFNERFKVAADYNMIRTIYDLGYTLQEIHTPVAVYDMYGFSVQNALRQIDEIAEICHKSGSFVHKKAKIIRRVKNFVKKFLKI